MTTGTLTVSIEVTQPDFSNPVEVPGFRVEGAEGDEFEGEALVPLELAPGTWTVIVDAPEVTPFEEEVSLEPGEEARLDIDVASLDGLLEVDLPEGVSPEQVRIDGSAYTPEMVSGWRLSPGRYTVTLADAPDHAGVSASATVRSGQTTVLDLSPPGRVP